MGHNMGYNEIYPSRRRGRVIEEVLCPKDRRLTQSSDCRSCEFLDYANGTHQIVTFVSCKYDDKKHRCSSCGQILPKGCACALNMEKKWEQI